MVRNAVILAAALLVAGGLVVHARVQAVPIGNGMVMFANGLTGQPVKICWVNGAKLAERMGNYGRTAPAASELMLCGDLDE